MFDSPVAYCSKCGKEFCLDKLHSLPEIEDYTRALSLSMLHGTKKPDLPDDDFLENKYHVKSNGLYCHKCLENILANS